MNEQLARYIMALNNGGGIPTAFTQQPQPRGLDINLIADYLNKMGRGIVGNPERGIFQVQRPQNLPSGVQRSPFFID